MVKLTTRIKHVHIFTKGAQTYVYFRRGGVKVRIRLDPNDAQGIRTEVERIKAELEPKSPSPSRHAKGTLGWLIVEYKRTDWWTTLKPATQASYERAFEKLEPLLPKPLGWLTRPRILRLRDEAWMPTYKRWMANYIVTTLGVLLKFAKDRGEITINPLAEKVRKIRKRPGTKQANRPWTADERRTVLDEADPHVRLALALIMCTGLRKTDVFAATMADIRDGDIAVVTSKRDEPISIPLHPVLAEAIAKRPGEPVGKIVVRRDGAPYTADGFDTVWHRFRARLLAAGKIGEGLTLHGLRHTLGTMLKEAGMSDGDIADVLGQASVSMARHYSKNAKLPKDSRAKILSLKIRGG